MKYKNNPLNIRFNPANNWQGQIRPVKGFCQFSQLHYGFRAAIKLLVRYRSFGCDTIRKMITRFAPPSDHNNTESYIDFVATRMNVSPDQPLSDDSIPRMVSIMVIIEQGCWNASWKRSIGFAAEMCGLSFIDYEDDCKGYF